MGQVRSAQARHLDRVVALWTALVQHHEPIDPAFHTAPRPDAEWRSFVERFVADADAAVLVWEADAEVLGFCAAQIRRAPPGVVERGRCELTDLFVRPDARRRGIGRELVAAALAWSAERDVRRVEVRVAAGNREGQAFWRAEGFERFVDVLQRRL